MVKLERTFCWYRPYTVIASGKEYVLEAIKFYDKDGNIVVSSSGWLENERGVDIQSIELDTDKITRRNKVKFDGEVFGTVCHSYAGSRLVLYIPMGMLNLHSVGKKKMFGDRIYECYKGDQDVFVTAYVDSLDKKLRVIKDTYSSLHERVGMFDMERNPDATISILKEMIDAVMDFKEERNNIDKIIVEE